MLEYMYVYMYIVIFHFTLRIFVGM